MTGLILFSRASIAGCAPHLCELAAIAVNEGLSTDALLDGCHHLLAAVVYVVGGYHPPVCQRLLRNHHDNAREPPSNVTE